MKGFPENRREILIKPDSSGIKIKAFSSRESNYTTRETPVTVLCSNLITVRGQGHV